ncbi:MAG: HAMP domain-containing protein [Alphaproteobacteria bacterium]|nr:HAMP domain-containing protein [Alphaproteobacteria bacterium]
MSSAPPIRPTQLLRSSAFRLGIAFAGLTATAAVILVAVAHWAVKRDLRQQIESVVYVAAAELEQTHAAGGLAALLDALDRRVASGQRSQMQFSLVAPDLRRIIGNLETLPAGPGWADIGEVLPGGGARGMRVLTMSVGSGYMLSVGIDREPITALETALSRAIWVVAAAIVALALAVGFGVARASHRRLGLIDARLDEIGRGALDVRLPTSGDRDEIDRMAGAMNATLDRLAGAVSAVEQVSNDIAHDLRTPLNRLRQRLERAGATAASADELRKAIDDAIAELDVTLGIFASMLRIAQIEAGARRSAFARVDLTALVDGVVETFTAVAEDEGRRLASAVARGVAVTGDREMLTQALVNLVENGLRHTPRASTVTVSLVDGPQGPVLAVADDGPGIPAADRVRVLQRFVRLEGARSTPGSGLGLALVAAVAEVHGAALALDDNGPGLRVELRFPAAPD